MQRFLIIIINFFLVSNVLADTSLSQLQQQKVQTLVDSLAKPFLKNNAIPGAAIAVYAKNKEYLFTYGYADKEHKIPVKPDTIFELASVTKIFTSSLLAYEVKANKVKLNDKIIKYLPDLSKTAGLAIDTIDLSQLATHTAGFPRDVEGFGIAKGNEKLLMQSLETWQPLQLSQNNYLYSNVGFGLLGRTLEYATKQDYYQLLNTIILQPLNMQNTYITVPVEKQKLQAQGYNLRGLPAQHYVPTYLLGGGALRSSAVDLLRFLEANLNVPAENAAPNLLAAFQFAQQPVYQVRPNFFMALGWQRITRNNTLFITKNGANQGFGTFIGFAPEKKFGVVVLMNKKQAKAGQLGNRILNQLNSV